MQKCEEKETYNFFEKIFWENGKKVAVLGSMLELGKISEQSHKKVVNYAVNTKIDILLLFGKEMQNAYNSISKSVCVCEWTECFDNMLELIIKYVKPGDLVLLKGSRGMELERLVKPIQEIAA